MKKVVRLTESELTNLIKNIVKESNIQEKWEGDVEVKKTGEYAGKSISELNAEIKKLKEKSQKLQDEGKKVPKSIKEKMSELYFAKRAKKDWPGKGKAKVNEDVENFFNPEAMSTGGAIATMVGTTIALLGIAGWDYLKELYHKLRNTEGKEQEAMELKSIIQDYENNKMNSDEEMDSEVEVDSMDIEEPKEPMAENIRKRTRRY
jgi:predicted RNase H-like nuclease (RuvC/YqgF family)